MSVLSPRPMLSTWTSSCNEVRGGADRRRPLVLCATVGTASGISVNTRNKARRLASIRVSLIVAPVSVRYVLYILKATAGVSRRGVSLW
jgi:hypothetical protein